MCGLLHVSVVMTRIFVDYDSVYMIYEIKTGRQQFAAFIILQNDDKDPLKFRHSRFHYSEKDSAQAK